MSDPKHPSDPNVTFYDIRDKRHPRPPMGGENLLVLNDGERGGTCIISPFYDGCRYWRYKPDKPKDPPAEFLLPMPPKRLDKR